VEHKSQREVANIEQKGQKGKRGGGASTNSVIFRVGRKKNQSKKHWAGKGEGPSAKRV